MLIEQKIKESKLSSSQNDVMKYLLQQREKIKDMTVKEIAVATFTSTGTIIRLTKKLGYHGYEEFKEAFLKEIIYENTHFKDINPNQPFESNDTIQRIASKMTLLAKETMADTLSLIEHDSLQKAVQLIKNSQHVHLAAISYSLLLGQMFQLDMMRIGVNVTICSINGEELFAPAIIQKEDCILIVSYSGEIKNLCALAKSLKEKGTSIIVITSIGDNELKKYADVVLQISTREKLYSKIGGFANEYSIKLILDILYSCYFTLEYEENFEKRMTISKEAEIERTSSLDIMKEKA